MRRAPRDAEYDEPGAIGKTAIPRDVARYVRRRPQRHHVMAGISRIALAPPKDKAFVRRAVDNGTPIPR